MDKSLLGQTEVRFKGKNTNVPSLKIDDCTIISTGRFLKTACVFDDELVERRSLPEPSTLLQKLRNSPLKADILTVSQRIPDTSPRFPFKSEMENWAILDTKFEAWWNALPQESRKNARLAEKRGVSVRDVPFTDEFVHSIKKIYDETPIRQGRAFWHYGKSFEAVKKENATYLDRSLFVGAYYNNELIGFIKCIRVDEIAIIIQILVMNAHRDKKVMNLLLRQTVDTCEKSGLQTLVYGKYNYGVNQDSPLMEFKRRNGFKEITFPQYYIPLTLKGRVILALGLHKGWKRLVPLMISTRLVKLRSWILDFRSPKKPLPPKKPTPPNQN